MAMTTEEKLAAGKVKLEKLRNKLHNARNRLYDQSKIITALKKKGIKDRQSFENAIFRLEGGFMPNAEAGIKKQFSI